MHVDATPSLVAVETPSLADLVVTGYLARYPSSTRANLSIHLRHWFEFCQQIGVNPLEARRAHIEAFGRWLDEIRHYKPRTQAQKISAVCGLYRFAFLDGYLQVDPAAHVRRPTVEWISSTQGLTRTEFADMLRAAEQAGPMQYALVCLLGMNGLRIGETCAANIRDLGYVRGYRTIYLPHRKGGKVGTLALNQRTAWAVDQAIAGRGPDEPILLTATGTRMNRKAAGRTVKRLAAQVGITKRIHPHSFRHTFVTLALDAGVPERDIIDSTGHSSSSMVRYYDRNRGAVERNATHAVAAFVGAAA